MIKVRVLLVFVAALFVNTGKAQVACDTARWVHSFSPDSLLEKSLQEYYKKGHFDRLLRKHGVKKISCGRCESVWVELVFTVDDKGKIVPLKAENAIICHNDKQKEIFIRNFYDSLKPLTVPRQFAGKCYRYRFGRALKC